MTAPTRPVLRYHGGKYRIAPWVISHFPAHRVYVEPFGGAASVLMRKPRSDFEVYNDLDSDVVNVFRVLRDVSNAAELRRLLTLTPWAREEFDLSYEETSDPIERARRTIIRCFMGHGTTSMRQSRTGFRAASHPGRRGGGFGDWVGYADAIDAFSARLQGVVIEHRPALSLIERHDADDTLFYIDPPYPLATRPSMRCEGDGGSRAYRHELNDDDHRVLAAALHRCRAAVVISGYSCPLYDEELYVGWIRETRTAMADHGRRRVECVWIKPAGSIPSPSLSFVQGDLAEVAS